MYIIADLYGALRIYSRNNCVFNMVAMAIERDVSDTTDVSDVTAGAVTIGTGLQGTGNHPCTLGQAVNIP